MIVAVAAALASATSGAIAQSRPIYAPKSELEITPGFGLEFTPDDSYTPKVLSRSTPTPIVLSLAAEVRTGDGSHPPPLRKLTIELDKNITVNLKRYPTCIPPTVEVIPPKTLAERCRTAIVGTGSMRFEIAFPEAQSKQIRSSVRIFNGTRKNGIRTLYLATYITLPVPAQIIVPVHIKKIEDGRYGSEAILTFPKIAGEGAITSLDLRIKKQLPLYGRRFSPIRAKCADGKLQFRDTATFSSSETAQTSELVRPCDSR